MYAPLLIGERLRILKRLVPNLDKVSMVLNGNNANNAAQSLTNVACRLWIQPIDATVWWNRSAGVSKFRVFLGRSFNLLATALSFACE
jgi:hypothetical protein